jgi:chemotaxis protein CheZ
MTRGAGELGAAVEVMEKSTDKILKSAETIDDSAKTLSTSLKDDYKAGLAQDILDQLTAIYEACNFQDLAGQRIGKVIGTLGEIDAALTQMLTRCQGLLGGEAAPAVPAPRRDLLNGPRLDGDAGHASQCEIDALFG